MPEIIEKNRNNDREFLYQLIKLYWNSDGPKLDQKTKKQITTKTQLKNDHQ